MEKGGHWLVIYDYLLGTLENFQIGHKRDQIDKGIFLSRGVVW